MGASSVLPADHTIADFIWENSNGEAASSQRLQSVRLSEYYAERVSTNRLSHRKADIQKAIVQLKLNPSASKDSIRSATDCGGTGAVLEHAVRLMFMTACHTEGTALGGYNIYKWTDNETLVAFFKRVYPHRSAGGIPEQSVNIRNLSAHILSKNARIEIDATDTLSDHLSLIQGEGFKTLLVYHHREFLERSLNILKADQEELNHSLPEAISLGCLPPKLLEDTLRTLDLLFPPFGDGRSRRILKKWVQRQDLDPDLLKPSRHSLGSPAGQELPDDLRGLYTQHPHWAPQLVRLLSEVDHPTPTTRWERYAERRKSPRHMYNCALAALIIAAVFGILATALAAVQVWISYCALADDPSKALCRK